MVDPNTGRKSVVLTGNVALFLDRQGSLLASAVLKSGFDAAATVNVYPGVLRTRSWAPGFWMQLLRNPGGIRFGVTSPIGGIGSNPPR